MFCFSHDVAYLVSHSCRCSSPTLITWGRQVPAACHFIFTPTPLLLAPPSKVILEVFKDHITKYQKQKFLFVLKILYTYGPRQANLVFIAYTSSEGSGEPVHPRSLARTSAARSYKQWVKRNLQTWPVWMAGHAQLKFVMMECSKTQICLTRPI